MSRAAHDRHLAVAILLTLAVSILDAEVPIAGSERVGHLIRRLNVSWDMDAQVDAKEAYDELRKLGRAAVPACLRAMAEGNPSARMWSAAAVAATRDPRAIEPMLKLLRDEHYKVRMIVSYHIRAFLEDARVAPALGSQLADPVEAVRGQAMKVLREAKPPAALPSVRKALLADDLAARADALRMVFVYEKRNLSVSIPEIVRSGENGFVRSAAVALLPTVAKMDKARALEFVSLARDHEPLVAEAALDVLRDIFKEPPVSGQDLKEVFEAAKAMIDGAVKHGHAGIREHAMPLLGHLKREEALPTLVSVLKQDPDAKVRAAAARGLPQTKLKDLRVLQPLLDALKDPAPEVRSSVLKLLAGLDKKDAISATDRAAIGEALLPQINNLVGDPAPTVRAAAYISLAQLLKGRSSETLTRAVRSEEDAKARKAAVLGLHLSGSRGADALGVVIATMGDSDPEVNDTAARVARKLLSEAERAASPDIVAQLRGLVGHTDPTVRARALPVFGTAAGAEALESMAKAVRTDPDATVRKAALEALLRTKVRNAAAVDTVIAALKDETTLVRSFAYRVFRHLTRQELVFHASGPPGTRERELAGIERWWKENRESFGE